MSVREKIEVTVFGSAIVIGLPAVIFATQAVAG